MGLVAKLGRGGGTARNVVTGGGSAGNVGT